MPNILIVGANGLLGTSTVRQASSNRYIQRVFTVTRKPLSAELAVLPKVTSLVVGDVERWGEETLWVLREGEVRACVWCIGGPTTSFPSLQATEHANIDLALLAATTFSTSLAPRPEKPFTATVHPTPFRFIYLSVSGAERNPLASAPWFSPSSWTETRKIKGQAERALFNLVVARERDGARKGEFEVLVCRLGKVLRGGQTTANIVTHAVSESVSADRVGRFCARVAVDGRMEGVGVKEEGGWLFNNAEVLGEDWADVDTLS